MVLNLDFWRSALNCYVHVFNFGFFSSSSLVENFFGFKQKLPIIKLVIKMEICAIIRFMYLILYLFTKVKYK